MLRPLAPSPARVGKPLTGEREGLYSARRGDYRIIYGINTYTRTVIVHRVQHRPAAYRRR